MQVSDGQDFISGPEVLSRRNVHEFKAEGAQCQRRKGQKIRNADSSFRTSEPGGGTRARSGLRRRRKGAGVVSSLEGGAQRSPPPGILLSYKSLSLSVDRT